MEHNCRLNEFIKKVDALKDMEGAVMPCLQEAQTIFGYIPEECVDIICEKLGTYPSEVYGVASFYSQFKLQKVGKHKISVCLGTACYVRGSDAILRECESVLGIKDGETTEDEFYSLDTVRCVGCCALAPLMMIDEQIFGNITPKDVKGIIDKFREENKWTLWAHLFRFFIFKVNLFERKARWQT